MQKPTTKHIIAAAKTLMLVLLCWAIYWQLLSNNKVEILTKPFNSKFEAQQWGFFLLAFLLIAVNFFCETQKWLILTKQFYKLSFKKTFKAILAGTTMAFFTPNRIGEYGGRVLFVPKKHIIPTVAVTMVGGLAQQIITLLFGLLSLIFLKDALVEKTLFTETRLYLITFISLVLIFFLLLVYFNIKRIIKLIPKVKRWQKHLVKLTVLQHYSKSTLLAVMLWAALKYLVFSIQFFCLIMAFGIPFKLLFVWLSMLSFLLQTVIPSVSLLELGVRGNVILFTFGAFTHLKIEILAASVTLWMFNLLIPAIIGALFILKINLDN